MAVKLGDRLAARTLMVGGGLLTAIGFAWFGLISVADGYGLGLTVSGRSWWPQSWSPSPPCAGRPPNRSRAARSDSADRIGGVDLTARATEKIGS